MILPNFAKNCMKLRKFWAVGGAPPKSATAYLCEGWVFPEKPFFHDNVQLNINMLRYVHALHLRVFDTKNGFHGNR